MSIAKQVSVYCLLSSRQMLSKSFRYNTCIHISLPGDSSCFWNWKLLSQWCTNIHSSIKKNVQFRRRKYKKELRASRETTRYAIEPQIAQSYSCASCKVFCSRTLGNGSRLPASACFQSHSRRKCTPRLGCRTCQRS